MKSHCCIADVDQRAFPYTCNQCGGACEPADEGSLTYEERVQSRIVVILRMFKQRSMNEETALNSIWRIVCDECYSVERNLLMGLHKQMHDWLDKEQSKDVKKCLVLFDKLIASQMGHL